MQKRKLVWKEFHKERKLSGVRLRIWNHYIQMVHFMLSNSMVGNINCLIKGFMLLSDAITRTLNKIFEASYDVLIETLNNFFF
jgi:hypothetical protein